MSSPAATAERPPATDRARERDLWRARRLTELSRRCLLLEGERERLEQLLAEILLMVTRGTDIDPMHLLDLACFAIDTNPGRATIHQDTA